MQAISNGRTIKKLRGRGAKYEKLFVLGKHHAPIVSVRENYMK